MKLSKAQVEALRRLHWWSPVEVRWSPASGTTVHWLNPIPVRSELTRKPTQTTLWSLDERGLLTVEEQRTPSNIRRVYAINDAGRAYLAALDKEELSQ